MDNQNQRLPAYRDHLLYAAPSLLSNLNRDPYSPTYGSFDREYWSWQSKDFSNTDFQRAVFPLSVLYLHDFDGNLYYNNPRLLTWIAAGLRFWCSIQHKNGSFDQWYPCEYSVGTTAFTLGPAVRTFSVLGEKLGQFGNLQKDLLVCFRKGADFICSEPESHGFISNHRAGMALSLAYSAKALNDKKYSDKAETIVKSIMEHQSPEGWFTEYGGADPGYESLGISYLAAYYDATKNEAVLDMLKNSVDFYVNFVHPDGTAGGEYGSRNTELFFPAGFELLRDLYSPADSILQHMSGSLSPNSGAIPSPSSVDIFNMIPLLDNYAQAFLTHVTVPAGRSREELKSMAQSGSDLILPCLEAAEPEKGGGDINLKYFDKSQLCTVRSKNSYCVAGMSKGGVVKIYDRKSKQLVYDNCGIFAQLDGTKPVTSQMLDFSRQIDIDMDENRVKVSGNLFFVRQKHQTPFTFFIFRLVTMTAGRVLFLNKAIKRILSKVLISPPGKAEVDYQREIRFEADTIVITDTIKSKNNTLTKLESGAKFVSIFMGSARYFQQNELTKKNPTDCTVAEKLSPGQTLTITDTITWDESGNVEVKREIDPGNS